MAGFNDVVEQAKQFWTSRTGAQKAFLLGGAAATVVAGGAVCAADRHARLQAACLPIWTPRTRRSSPRNWMPRAFRTRPAPMEKRSAFPRTSWTAARMQTASQGEPHSGRMGFELFDKMSWGQTEFDEKVAYQRALEGELERTIQTLAEVESARVHLVMPTDSVFLDRQRGAKASVILKLQAQRAFQRTRCWRFRAWFPERWIELKPEDVSIIDADSDRSLGLGHDGASSGEGEEARLTERLINTLEPVVGTNKIRASVNVDHDQGTTEKSQEKYDPTVSAVLSDQKIGGPGYGGGAVPMGVPGTASNIPSAKQTKPTVRRPRRARRSRRNQRTRSMA